MYAKVVLTSALFMISENYAIVRSNIIETHLHKIFHHSEKTIASSPFMIEKTTAPSAAD